MHLWRPVGFKEMGLVFDSGMSAFPPRLPDQPIFYPVLNPGYAEQIARDWNTQEEDAAGYVTRFELPDSFSDRYERRVVGGSIHEEWWVPAAELAEFNRAIVQPITVEAAFFGASFTGLVCSEAGLKGKDAREQFIALAHHLDYSSFDVWCETYVNRKAVFLHYPFWASFDPTACDVTQEQKRKLLGFVQHRWSDSDIHFPLPRIRGGEPDGAANRSQPVGQETNRTSSAAGSGG
jgi:hypothetical protein